MLRLRRMGWYPCKRPDPLKDRQQLPSLLASGCTPKGTQTDPQSSLYQEAVNLSALIRSHVRGIFLGFQSVLDSCDWSHLLGGALFCHAVGVIADTT